MYQPETRHCEKCHHLVGINSRSCLYCGARLAALADGLSIPLEALPAGTVAPEDDDGAQDYIVMVTPPREEITDSLVGTLAQAFGADAFIMRQRLLRGKPFLGAGGISHEEARRAQEALAGRGIAASFFREAAVAALPDPIEIRTGDLQDDEAVLVAAGGREIRLPYAGIFLVVQGEVSEKRLDVVKTRRIARMGMGELVPGETKTIDRHVSRNLRVVVDVYTSGSFESYRLEEGVFGAAGALSGRENVLSFVRELRSRAPGEVFDASFGEMDAVQSLRRDQRAWEGVLVAHRTEISDNRSELDSYSAHLYLHVLRLRAAAAPAPEA